MTRTLVTAIVSTAAEGAERGALDAAIEIGIGYGGRTAAAELPPIYASRMRGVGDRGMAVRLNVQDSDGTLIVSFADQDQLTGRTKHAGDQCKAQRKPAKHLVLTAGSRTRIPDGVRVALLKWIDDSHISVLHVVGPGEEQEPGIAEATRDALVWVLEDDHAADAQLPEGRQTYEPSLDLEYIKPSGSFAGVDRSAAPESLQHVAEPMSLAEALPLAVERIRRYETQRPVASPDLAADIEALAASRVDPACVFDPAAQRQRELAAAAVVLGGILAPPPVPPEVWAERDRLRDLAGSVDATGALTVERRTEIEASIRQAVTELSESRIDSELLLTLGPCPKCGRLHRPHYCECGHTPEIAAHPLDRPGPVLGPPLLHLVSNDGSDESEVWCEAHPTGLEYTREPSEANCRDCLIRAANYGQCAADRIPRYRSGSLQATHRLPGRHSDDLGSWTVRLYWKSNDEGLVHWVDFELFEVTGLVGNERRPEYPWRGATTNMDTTANLDEAVPAAHGFVKWDGCTQFDVSSVHVDSLGGLNDLFSAIGESRRLCADAMPGTWDAPREYP